MSGRAGATYLIVFRIFQGVGGACLLANAAAIITDAFPADQRGLALGINNIVGVSGLFVGLVLGGTARADRLATGLPDLGPGRALRDGLGLPETGGAQPAASRVDRLVGQRHLRPRADPDDGRRHLRDPSLRRPPDRLGQSAGDRPLAAAMTSLVAFAVIERRVAEPMFASRCFASAPSPSAPSRPSWPRSPAAV